MFYQPTYKTFVFNKDGDLLKSYNLIFYKYSALVDHLHKNTSSILHANGQTFIFLNVR